MRTKIAIEPVAHPWRDGIAEGVQRAGADIAEVREAEVLVWLGGGNGALRAVLHPNIRWVQLHAAGVETWIDNGEIDRARIFTAARGAYADVVAEHALALLLAAARRLAACARAHAWDPGGSEGRSLAGSTVGILGAGGIGQQLIRLLHPLAVRTLAVTRSGRTVPGATASMPATSVHELWPQVDYLVLAAPVTPDTRAIVGREELEAMPEHAWVINIARGSLVDTDALVDALRRGVIAGAGLDVTDPEPLPDDHELWRLPNALITPHVANPAPSRRARLEALIETNIARYLAGDDLLGVVDLERGY